MIDYILCLEGEKFLLNGINLHEENKHFHNFGVMAIAAEGEWL